MKTRVSMLHKGRLNVDVRTLSKVGSKISGEFLKVSACYEPRIKGGIFDWAV